jgi:glucose-1-phosphate thymidylyltransferase
MRGLILAGGKGTRLLPATKVVNKHMVPILNKPMIMYPLETLKYLGITNIMITTGGNHVGGIADFLGDGSEFGVQLTYRIQRDAGGIAQALSLAQDFVGDDEAAVILGDNVFENNMLPILDYHSPGSGNATFFVKEVKDPQRFGVFSYIDGIAEIEEKPKNPKSNKAVTGLYVYPPDVFSVVARLKPSARGELEISDVNNYFIKNNRYHVVDVQGFWSDAGTPESLMEVTVWAYKKSRGLGS